MPSPNRLQLEITLTNDQGVQRFLFDSDTFLLRSRHGSSDIRLYPRQLALLMGIIQQVKNCKHYFKDDPDAQ